MFAKLLKYDFRTMLKSLGLAWVAVLVLATIARISNTFAVSKAQPYTQEPFVISAISMVLFACVAMAACVLTVVFVVGRFNKGLLGDEGYLMHSLPVSVWALVGSKLVVAVVAMCCSLVLAVAAFAIMVPSQLLEISVWEALINLFGAQQMARLPYQVLLLCCSIAATFSSIYLALALGHLVPKHKTLVAFGSYIVLNIAVEFVETAVGYVSQSSMKTGSMMMGGLMLGADLYSTPVFPLMLTAAFFVATCLLLQKRLNLE